VKQHQSFVGFSSWKISDQTFSNGDLIEFVGVRYNDDGHYFPELNSFYCPTTGLYYVTVNFGHFSVSNKELYLGVTQNSLTVLHSSHPDAYINVFSNSRLLRCQQHDTLMVRGTGDGHVDGNSFPYTTFSVMLIHDEGEFLFC